MARRSPRHYADILPPQCFDTADDTTAIVINRDGARQQTYQVQGYDLAASTPAEYAAKVLQFANAFKALSPQAALFFDTLRLPVVNHPEATQSHPVLRALDHERQARFAEHPHYESTSYLTLVVRPPHDVPHGMKRLFWENLPEQRRLDDTAQRQTFATQAQRFIDLIVPVFLHITPLNRDQTATYLHTIFTLKNHPVVMDTDAMHLNVLLGDADVVGGLHPQIGAYHLHVVSILGYPGQSRADMFGELNRLDFPLRYTSRFLPVERLAALRSIANSRRQWDMQQKSPLTYLYEHLFHEDAGRTQGFATARADESDEAHERVANTDLAVGHYTGTFLVWDHDPRRAEHKRLQVERVVQSQGFTTHHETFNALEALLGSFPGNTVANKRHALLSVRNLAHLVGGFSATWSGPRWNTHLDEPPLLMASTESFTSPFRLSLHVGGVGHTFIVGPTGSGKSVLLSTIMANFLRYTKAQVFAFDLGNSCRALMLSLGGAHHDIGADGGTTFQPLIRIDDLEWRQWAATWLEAWLQDQGIRITPEVTQEIWSGLATLAAAPARQRTLTALSHLLQDHGLRQALAPFTIEGTWPFLDADHDSVHDGHLVAFELGHLVDHPRLRKPVLQYLIYLLEHRRFNGAPTALVLDESWAWLRGKTGLDDTMAEWLRTLRRKNVAVIFATQAIEDVTASPQATVILQSCPTKIFLPDAQATDPVIAPHYAALGLNATEIRRLSQATPRSEYYLVSPEGRRLFQLGLGPLERALYGSSTPEDQHLISALLKQYGADGFAPAFLRAKGFDALANHLKEDTTHDASSAVATHD